RSRIPQETRAVTEHEPATGRPASAPHHAGRAEPQSAIPQSYTPQPATPPGAHAPASANTGPFPASPNTRSFPASNTGSFPALPGEPVPDFALDQPRDPEWYRRAVFYEVLIRGFHDANGDGTGDIRGLTSRLDYLQWLGIDCIWLLPIYESPLR